MFAFFLSSRFSFLMCLSWISQLNFTSFKRQLRVINVGVMHIYRMPKPNATIWSKLNNNWFGFYWCVRIGISFVNSMRSFTFIQFLPWPFIFSYSVHSSSSFLRIRPFKAFRNRTYTPNFNKDASIMIANILRRYRL